MSAPKTVSCEKENVTTRSPFLFTSQEFIGKMIDRGFEVNIELRNRLYILASSHVDNITLQMFWKDCPFENEIEKESAHVIKHMRHLLILFSTLEKYKVNYVNLVVLFAGMTLQQRKNLFRHYYLEWVKLNGHSDGVNRISWEHTPREFSQLEGDALERAWYHMIEQFLCTDHFARVVFFINQFYTYMAPFI